MGSTCGSYHEIHPRNEQCFQSKYYPIFIVRDNDICHGGTIAHYSHPLLAQHGANYLQTGFQVEGFKKEKKNKIKGFQAAGMEEFCYAHSAEPQLKLEIT